MKVNGIIAEYNPFHNGHRYHIEKSKELTGADYTVVVMSGNFVQRGAPALVEKYSRARMALENGADLVIELPSIYACASAEYFATAAVSLLTGLGPVTHLCFGSEYGEIGPFRRAAEVFLQEPEGYVNCIKYHLRRGMTYPCARLEALIQYDPSFASLSNLFRHPNNVLGIEYIKALMKLESSISPVTILRSGSAYNDPNPGVGYCSALAIREALVDGFMVSSLGVYMPENVIKVLQEIKQGEDFVTLDRLSSQLYYKLQLEPERDFTRYQDVSQELSDRILNKLPQFTTYSKFCDLLKTKDMTYTRISRCLLHILLQITSKDLQTGMELGYAPYARVLGFRQEATPLLHSIKEQGSIPLITKLADAHKLLPEGPLAMLKQDIRISQFYYGMLANPRREAPVNEYTLSPIIL